MKLIQSLFIIAGLFLAGCSWDKSKPNVEIIQDMMEQPAVKAQKADDFFPDHAGGARVPPENTQPVGFKPYKFYKNPDGAKDLKNPFAGSSDDQQVLLTGQKYYETNCMICHGMAGHGDGSVAAKMTVKRPPSLMTAKIRGWTDGQIYNVITAGQGLMGPYASHIPQQYRWQVVSYIRLIQKNEKVDSTQE